MSKDIVKGLFIIFLASHLTRETMGADRSKFKSCEQSSFCQRNRNHKPFEQKWALDMSTVKQDGLSIVGQIFDEQNQDVRLQMVVSLTDQGSIRLKIDELDSLRKRFEAVDALNPKLKFKKLELAEKESDKLVFVFGRSNQQVVKNLYRLTIRSSPFTVDVTDPKGNVVTQLNSKGFMRFEDYRELRRTGNSDQKSEMFGAPKEAQAYDEAGRPIGQSPGPTSDENNGDQASTESIPVEPEATSYAETFSTFTDSRPYGAMSVGMDIYFPTSDHVYGIPEHADKFQLQDTRPNIGDPYRLYNVDIFEYELNSPMSLYGAIPFMMAHSKRTGSFGVLWLNPSETWIDIESNKSQSQNAGVVDMISSLVSSDKKMSGRLTHWFSETGLVDVWFMPGPDPITVMSYNAEILGTIPMPPVYSTGFHQCRWNYYSTDEVMQVDSGYDRVEVPLDAIWLDIEYTEGRSKKYFTWDPIAFHDHVEMANNLTAKGRRLIAIIDPHIKKESGYDVFDEGNKLDVWVKDASGQNAYEGWCWPGASMWPDYFNPKVRDWWETKFDPAYWPGDSNTIVDLWNDMNEPSVFSGPEVTAPRDLRHVDGWEHRDLHNMYGFQMTKATFEGMSKYRGHLSRPFILTRSLFAGSQRYCAAWTGDNQARWDHLQATIPMLLSLSVSGMPFVGADVGGFFNNPESDELLIRWHQAGAFQPFFRAHAHHDARHREAYQFQGQILDLIRNAISLRYSYAPFWYTLFYEAHRTGMPMMRPLWFHERYDENTFDMDDEYLLGSSLLVKPVSNKGVKSIDVYLPGTEGESAWFCLNTHMMHAGGKHVTLPVELQTVPLYQRAGTIIPRYYRLRRSVEILMRDPITIDVVLTTNSEGKLVARGTLYMDEFKQLEPNSESSLLRDIQFYDDQIHIKSSGSEQIAHGTIERVLVYNWPTTRKIASILAFGSGVSDTTPVSLQFNLNQPRADGTALLEIKTRLVVNVSKIHIQWST